jgi:OmcA/MtrC family decaheme c-type cytochrome
MNRPHFAGECNLRRGLAAALVAATLALAGCFPSASPDEADPGATPSPGDATALNIEITDAQVSSPPVVTFEVTDQDGRPFEALASGNVAFTFAKLVPRADGGADWQNYINRTDPGSSSVGPDGAAVLDPATTVQGNTESNGTLEHLGGGVYQYTFRTDVTDVTTPAVVEYDPTLTHRVGLQLSNPMANTFGPVNAWFDFVPAGGHPITTRNVATAESCNSCHERLAFHGGGRVEVEYCVTCHNPGSTDANSGNTLDFKVLVHKLHRGRNLPSVAGGGLEYAIWGFSDAKHDYSDVGFPRDVRSCDTCHTASETTPDGDNWQARPTRAACGSCHDDIDFDGAPEDWQRAHTGGPQTSDTGCAFCHAPGGFGGAVADKHITAAARVAEAGVTYEILDVTLDAERRPQVTWRVLQNGNPIVDGEGGWTINTGVLVGWGPDDYVHSVGNRPGDPMSVGNAARADATTANTDGSYTTTMQQPVPQGVGSGVAALQHVVAHADMGTLVPKNVVFPFPVDGGTATPRRTIVAMDNCYNCHEHANGAFSKHGPNSRNQVELCAICHNSNSTDIDRRTRDGQGDAPDGKREQATNLMVLIHGIHAAEFRQEGLVVAAAGVGTWADKSSMRFPGTVDNCETCHLPGTYQLPLAASARGTTMDTSTGARDAIDSHLKTTPMMAACSSCHDGAKQHMTLMGGGREDVTQADIDSGAASAEMCVSCHGTGAIKDVRVVHAIR